MLFAVKVKPISAIFTTIFVYFPISDAVTFADELNFDFDLPSLHAPYFFNRRPDLRERCLLNSSCPFKSMLEDQVNAGEFHCFGYENDCDFGNSSFSHERLQCPGQSNWNRVQTKEEQNRVFWNQGDFGFLKERAKYLKLICAPQDAGDLGGSSLLCSDHLRYCYAKNMMIDFKHLKSRDNADKYRSDVIKKGDVGGRCRVDVDLLKSRADQESPLQSWAAELKNFQRFKNLSFDECDVVFEKPVILIKLDAGISMYHHFCDFVNLYASQHLNGSFHRDVHIVQWDTSGNPYGDFFAETWRVFTDLPLIQLKELDGKKVCFRQAMFPLLARMIFGLYYNMPLIGGCLGSGLIQAFSEHVLHRLKLVQKGPRVDGRLRVTFLTRNTRYRRILNENEIISGLKTMIELDVRKVDYAQLPFLSQLNRSMNTDIFMGVHGSGLTHLLFLPDWAAVFEIYNCDDPNCYADLSRLRGVGYFTWERSTKLRAEDEGHHPTLGAHAKFTNYFTDLEEFLRLTSKTVQFVKDHQAYRNALSAKRNAKRSEKNEL